MISSRRAVYTALAALISLGVLWLYAAAAASAIPADPPGGPWGNDSPEVVVVHTSAAPVWQFVMVAAAAVLFTAAVMSLVGHARHTRPAPPDIIQVREII